MMEPLAPPATSTDGTGARQTFLGLGARDGDRPRAMAEALRRLESAGARVVRVSMLYETEPVGLPGGRPLLNAAAELAVAWGPAELLRICLETEEAMGRRRSPERPDRGPRPIDLDLLLFGSVVVREPCLELPHPRLHLRRFVLAPLAEIAPAALHPLLGETVAALLARCEDPCRVRPWASAGAWWPAAGAARGGPLR